MYNLHTEDLKLQMKNLPSAISKCCGEFRESLRSEFETLRDEIIAVNVDKSPESDEQAEATQNRHEDQKPETDEEAEPRQRRNWDQKSEADEEADPRQKRADQKPEDDEKPVLQDEEHSIAYLIISAYVFAFGSAGLISCEIIDFFRCGLLYTSGTNQYKNHRIRLAFLLIMLCFTAGQVAFLAKYLQKLQTISDSIKLRFFLVHLFATNIVLYIFFVAQESGIFLGGLKKHHNIENLTCLGVTKNNSDKFHDALPDLREYLEPFVIEYILIVAGLLYNILHHISYRKYHQSARKIDETSSHEPIDEEPVVVKSPKQDQEEYYCLPILAGLLIVIMIAVPASLKNDRHYILTLLADYCIQIFVFFTEILVSCSILAQLFGHKYTAPELKTDDKLLLFSMTLGIITFNLFTLIAAIAGTQEELITVEGVPRFKPSLHSGLLLVFCFLNAISVCFVSYAIIITQRFQLQITDEGSKTVTLLRAGVLYLLIINCGHYVNDAFFELKHDGTTTYSIGQQFYQDFAWQLINRGVYPLCVFYRFHAAAMLVSIWVRFRGAQNCWANCTARLRKKTPETYQLAGDTEDEPLE